LGLDVNCQAPLFIMPGPAAYVGGDIVSGVMALNIHRSRQITVLIDLGTNGEIVLGNREWLLAAAASAGPAFEGGGVSCGMPYARGAVFDVRISDCRAQPQLQTVGGAEARGICGSGLLALTARLLELGVMEAGGRLRAGWPNIRSGEDGLEYVLGQGLFVTEADLQNLLRAKAAIYAALNCLLQAAGLDFAAVDRVILGGGWGNALNLQHAVTIGLLPELASSRFLYAGNTSLTGARRAARDRKRWQEAAQLSITTLELSTMPEYMDHYIAAMFFPHTQAENLFPATWRRLRRGWESRRSATGKEPA
jgi:uncharacterized 2Fe-2S/4Fe-4S cluster protein (DUF4445 family)